MRSLFVGLVGLVGQVRSGQVRSGVEWNMDGKMNVSAKLENLNE